MVLFSKENGVLHTRTPPRERFEVKNMFPRVVVFNTLPAIALFGPMGGTISRGGTRPRIWGERLDSATPRQRHGDTGGSDAKFNPVDAQSETNLPVSACSHNITNVREAPADHRVSLWNVSLCQVKVRFMLVPT